MEDANKKKRLCSQMMVIYNKWMNAIWRLFYGAFRRDIHLFFGDIAFPIVHWDRLALEFLRESIMAPPPRFSPFTRPYYGALPLLRRG